MRGTLNVIAAARGEIDGAATDLGDIEQTASVQPIPVSLGSATVTVAGGASPTNAVITLGRAVPGVGASATIVDDEFSTAPWQAHRAFQAGDKWAFGVPQAGATDGASDGVNTWWANPLATSQAATVYPPPANGALSLGLMNTPAGIGISQPFIGTIINDLNFTGGHLFGYHEFRVKGPTAPGLLFQWDIEDFLISSSWNLEIDFRLWIDAGGAKHVNVQMSGSTISPLVVYQSTALDITQYHTYGINWQSDHITVYVDGKQVGQALNPGGVWITNACFAYMLTSAGSFFSQNDPTPTSLPAFVSVDYYRLFSNLPTTAGSVLVHAYNGGGIANSITDSVGQSWVRHPDARIGSAPFLTALSNNTLPMVVGSTITVGFIAPSGSNTPGTAAAWYVPYINGSSFGSLANVGSTGATPNAPSITAAAPSATGTVVFVTLPTSGPALNNGVVQVQYRITGATAWTSVASPPQYISPTFGSIVDGSGNTWTLANGGNPVANGITDTVSRAQQLFLIGTTLWQFDGTSWYSFTPSGTITTAAQFAWASQGATSPLLLNGIAVTGLSSGTKYDLTAYVSNAAGVGAQAPIVQITTTGVGSATLFDDFNTLNLYNAANPQPGQLWEPAYSDQPNGGPINDCWFVNPNFASTPITNLYTVSGGNLSMGVDNTPTSLKAACGNQPFVGANLQTVPTFTQTYGYFEVTVAVQPLAGSEFAFVLYGPGSNAQIDVIEITTDQGGFQSGGFALWNSTSSQVLANVYTYNAVGVGVIDCSQMHAYGVYISPTTVTFYIDRVAQGSWPTPPGYNVPLYLSMGMFSGGTSFLGTITDTAALPKFANIANVGVWTSPPFATTTITGLTLSNTNLTLPVSAGTTVGTFSATLSSGSFTGTFSTPPAGADGASFAVNGATLSTSIALATARPYAITETATQAGISNSPFTSPFSINVTSGPVVGPTASGFLTADFTAPMNYPNGGSGQINVLRGLWGASSGAAADLGFAMMANSAITTGAAKVNWGSHMFLDVPWFNSDLSINTSLATNLLNNFWKWDPLGISSIIMGCDYGPKSVNVNGDPSRYATGMKNLFSFLRTATMSNGQPLPLLGMTCQNEPDIANVADAVTFFNAAINACRQVDPNVKFFGPMTENYSGSWSDFATQCGNHIYGYMWNMFPTGGGTSSTDNSWAGNSEAIGSFTDASNQVTGSNVQAFAIGGWAISSGAGSNADASYPGAYFMAKWVIDALNNSKFPVYMCHWEHCPDTIQGFGGPTTIIDANGNINPAGWVQAQGVRKVFGPRWQVTTAPAGFSHVAVTPSAGHCSMLIVNLGGGAQNNKTVAFSHWPFNGNGNGSATVWQFGTQSQTYTTNDPATVSAVGFTNGVSVPINFPDPSITIISI